jgi:hypothetical protein
MPMPPSWRKPCASLATGEARAAALTGTAAGWRSSHSRINRRQRRHHPGRCRQQLAGDQRAGSSLQQLARGDRQTGCAARPGVRRSVDCRSDQRQGGGTGHPMARRRCCKAQGDFALLGGTNLAPVGTICWTFGFDCGRHANLAWHRVESGIGQIVTLNGKEITS